MKELGRGRRFGRLITGDSWFSEALEAAPAALRVKHYFRLQGHRHLICDLSDTSAGGTAVLASVVKAETTWTPLLVNTGWGGVREARRREVVSKPPLKA